MMGDPSAAERSRFVSGAAELFGVPVDVAATAARKHGHMRLLDAALEIVRACKAAPVSEARVNGITWIQTYLGLAFDLDAPRVEQIEIEDIAHALSNICRYNGHCAWHYSVAQHSVYVAQLIEAVEPELALVGLLHDSAEAYIGDWSSPLKQVFRKIAIAVLGLEHDIERVIGERYGVDLVTRNKLIKQADLVTLADEKAALFGPSPRPNWAASSGYAAHEPSGRAIERWTPEYAKARFLSAFERYGGKS